MGTSLTNPGGGRRASLAARLCGYAFSLTLPLALLIAEAGRMIFDPASLSQTLARIAFETEALPLGLAWLTQVSTDGNPAFGDAQLFSETSPLLRLVVRLEAEEWRAVLDELLPSGYLADSIQETTYGLDLWLDGAATLSQVSYDLTELKARALSGNGLRAVRIGFEVLPPCTPTQTSDELGAANIAPLNRELLALPCALPQPRAEDQFYAYAGTVPELVEGVRDSFTLADALYPGADPSLDPSLESTRAALGWARLATRLAPLLPAVLLAAILALQVRSRIELAGRWSPLLEVGGLIVVAMALGRLEILRLALRAAPEGEQLLREILFEVGSGVAAEMVWPLLVRGAVALGLGLALRAYAASVKRRGNVLTGAAFGVAAE